MDDTFFMMLRETTSVYIHMIYQNFVRYGFVYRCRYITILIVYNRRRSILEKFINVILGVVLSFVLPRYLFINYYYYSSEHYLLYSMVYYNYHQPQGIYIYFIQQSSKVSKQYKGRTGKDEKANEIYGDGKMGGDRKPILMLCIYNTETTLIFIINNKNSEKKNCKMYSKYIY